MRGGKISDPYTASYYGIGYRGIGEYIAESKAGRIWSAMLQRCYSENYHKRQPTYKGCSVCEEWLDFQNFAKWFEENYIEGYHLDKDILVKGNKVYSPDTCCFVPRYINSQFNGNQLNKKDLTKGIFYYRNKYKVEGTRRSKRVYLGLYDTLKEAQKIYADFKTIRVREEAVFYKDQLNKRVFNILINYNFTL